MKIRALCRFLAQSPGGLLWVGVGLAVLFWVLESAMDAFVFGEGGFAERLVSPDPNEAWMRMIIATILVGFGVYGSSVLRARKRAEEEREALLAAYREQSQLLTTSNLELQKALAEVKQADEKLQEAYQQEKTARQEVENEIRKRAEFARALVHELKTPLVPVMSSSDMLADGLEEEPWLSLARNINRGAARLNERIDELLDIARGELGVLEADLKPLDPLPILQEAANGTIPLATSRSQSLAMDLPPSLPIAHADEGRLRQVLQNLLNNASKFTPEGGAITLSARAEDGHLVVAVQDTGPGIAEEVQKRLFDPYYQAGSHGQGHKGLGLGLALCKKLVELHGGQIWLASQIGGGATFSFSIPLEAPDRQAKTREEGGPL